MSSATPATSIDANALANAAGRRTPESSVVVSLWALYGLTLRQYLHGKRWMVIAALFLLPAGLAILIRATASKVPSEAIEFLMVFMFIPQAILPLVSLLYASGMIHDEQEEQTITYLLVRPLPKWALYVVKLLATITTAVLLTAIFTLFTYAAIYVGATVEAQSIPIRCLKAISIHSLAVMAYCCMFGLISLLTKRSLVIGIVYIAVVEGILANLPFGIRLITIIYYTRLIAFRTLDFNVSTPHGAHDMAADGWQFNVRLDPGLLEHPQLATCLYVLLIGSLVCAALAAFVFSRREFRVKTPENN